jgi:hypothetical protein
MTRYLYLLLFVFTLLCWRAEAQAPNTSQFATFTIKDMNGQELSTDSLRQTRNWILVVIDPNLQSAQKFMNALPAKQDLIEGRVVFLSLGTPALTRALMAKNEKYSSARWFNSTNTDLSMKALRLSGLPTILAVNAEHKISWQYSGLPEPAEKVADMVRGWVSRVTLIK